LGSLKVNTVNRFQLTFFTRPRSCLTSVCQTVREDTNGWKVSLCKLKVKVVLSSANSFVYHKGSQRGKADNRKYYLPGKVLHSRIDIRVDTEYLLMKWIRI